MNGDLGNLLTGELGEAEARFSREDFAADFGQRIAGRVRRRRAVRAAGVGGGTMLTAGALVVGATHVPWGTLGAEPGVGGSDCATPWPSVTVATYSVVIDTDQGSLTNLTIMEAATGTMIVGGVQQADGTYLFTDGYGDPLTAVKGSAGLYTVALPPGVTLLESTSTDAYRSAAVSTSYLSVHPPTLVIDDGGAERQARGDCYTPSPTPSVVPSLSTDIFYTADGSLAAKPEDVTSPFQCGFEFPTESYGTDGLWIDSVEWFTASDVEAAHEKLFGANAALTFTDPNALVPRVAVHRVDTPLADGQSASGVRGTWDPSLEKVANLALGGISAQWVSAEGSTFVGVAGGKVVATGTLPENDDAAATSVLTGTVTDGDRPGELMYLIDPSVALTSCDANPVDLTQVDIVAVAGVIVKHADGTIDGPTYAWLPIGKP